MIVLEICVTGRLSDPYGIPSIGLAQRLSSGGRDTIKLRQPCVPIIVTTPKLPTNKAVLVKLNWLAISRAASYHYGGKN